MFFVDFNDFILLRVKPWKAWGLVIKCLLYVFSGEGGRDVARSQRITPENGKSLYKPYIVGIYGL